jgi:hypothetical protein
VQPWFGLASLEYGIAEFKHVNTIDIPVSTKLLKPNLTLLQVERLFEEKFGPILFPDDDKDSRICPR